MGVTIMKKLLILSFAIMTTMAVGLYAAQPQPEADAAQKIASTDTDAQIKQLKESFVSQTSKIAELIKQNDRLMALLTKAIEASPKGKEAKKNGKSVDSIKGAVIKVLADVAAQLTFYAIVVGVVALATSGYISLAWVKSLIVQIVSFVGGIFGKAALSGASAVADAGQAVYTASLPVVNSTANAAFYAVKDAGALVQSFIPEIVGNVAITGWNAAVPPTIAAVSSGINSVVGNHTTGAGILAGIGGVRVLANPRVRHFLITAACFGLSIVTLGAV